jgi:hypothetical protein
VSNSEHMGSLLGICMVLEAGSIHHFTFAQSRKL